MRESGTRKATILIVDDVSENLHMLMDTLGDGYRFVPAKNGESALRKAENTPFLDLVLLDIMMPEMDGYEVLRRLKKHPRLKGVPVIFITAVAEASDGAKGFHLGAVDYITKPFIPEVVRARVTTHVELKQKTDLLEQLANTDGLTGVFNRRKIDHILDNEFRRATRSGSALSLAFIDIDHFKRFNDYYGHSHGDECLKRVSRAVRDMLKRPSDAIGRYGGEEFLVVLADTDGHGATSMANSFVNKINKLAIEHQDSPTAVHVTISVGCATTRPRQDGPALNYFLDVADKMLYAAKASGRNQVRSAVIHTDSTLLKT